MGQSPGEAIRVLKPSVSNPCLLSPRGEEREGEMRWGGGGWGRQEEGKKKEKNSDHRGAY